MAGEDSFPGGDIVAVDDNPDNLRLLAAMLGGKGYRVRPVVSARHALTAIRAETPDLVLLDILMPEMDGYEVCRVLRSDEQTRHIPVIFLSALDEVQNKIKGFEVGGVDYITKPFHEEEVLQRVKTHLTIHDLRRKLLAETLRFKTLSEATFEAVILHSGNRIVDTNPAAERLLDRPRQDLAGADLAEFLPQEALHLILSGTAEPFRGDLIVQDAEPLPVEIRTKGHPAKGQEVCVTTFRDLRTERQMEDERSRLLRENTALRVEARVRFRFGDIIGRSPEMQRVYDLISKAAGSEYPVAISGESGTGKELVARTIHSLNRSKDAPFITVNCGAVPESLFEREFFGHRKGAFTGAVRDEPGYFAAAHNGTLFLDEIGELPTSMQVKLLRVLQDGEYTPVGAVEPKQAKVRVVTATNRDLSEMVRNGTFREDLFYRIIVIEISLPPLRDRRGDIRLLVEHFLNTHQTKGGLEDLPAELRATLTRYDWPGNVRELMNTIQRYLATSTVSLTGIGQMDQTPPTGGLHGAVESLEKRMIEAALEKTNGHRGRTAELLRIPRRSLHRKISKYALDA